MCGIVGYITTEQGWKGVADRDAFMEQALVIDILRGEDSTGIMYANDISNRGGYMKKALNGYDFVNTQDYVDLVRQSQNFSFAVGHNRAATIGSVSWQTAHPFMHGEKNKEVIGLHNGTVRGNMPYLPIPMDKSGESVDSSCIIKNLAHVDPDEALTKVVSKIDGAYMLVWQDPRNGTLNFARNDTRTFHMAQSYTQNTLFFASEFGQLAWLNDRNHLGISDIYKLDPGTRLAFKEGSLEPEVEKFDIAPKYVKPVVKRAPIVTTPGPSGGSNEPGKPTARYYSAGNNNKVTIGGKKRDVPQSLQMAMMHHGLAIEDRMNVTPMTKQHPDLLKTPTGRRYVLAYCNTTEDTVLITGVESHVCENAWDRQWSVRPVGIKYTSPDQKEYMVLARVVASVGTQEKLTLREPNASSTSSTEESPKGEIGGVRGPGGCYVSKAEWLVLTSCGCVSCGKPLSMENEWDIEWDAHDNPTCASCYDRDQEALSRLAEDHYAYGDVPWH